MKGTKSQLLEQLNSTYFVERPIMPGVGDRWPLKPWQDQLDNNAITAVGATKLFCVECTKIDLDRITIGMRHVPQIHCEVKSFEVTIEDRNS